MTDTPAAVTPSQGIGPLYTFALIFDGCENAVEPGSPGALRIEGNVFDGKGTKLCAPDATLEFLQGDQFARTSTDDLGNYHVTVRKPEATPLPDGRLQAPHFDIVAWIFPLIEPLHTRVYFPEDEAAHRDDPVLSLLEEDARRTLIATREGDVLRFDVRVSGDGQTAFFVPEGLPSVADSEDILVRPFNG